MRDETEFEIGLYNLYSVYISIQDYWKKVILSHLEKTQKFRLRFRMEFSRFFNQKRKLKKLLDPNIILNKCNITECHVDVVRSSGKRIVCFFRLVSLLP